MEKGMVLANTYEILEEIGSGGGGVVYRARHTRLNTDVVVKKIKDEIVNRVNNRQEADILKRLKHPYLPRVYDFIETEDAVYTVMDYIRGTNLQDAVKEHGTFEPKQVLKWTEQLGEAVAYLHSQNPPIIHSDIKPANIMLTENGDVCLIDFNISLALGNTMESAVGISAGYSPPEQYADPALFLKVFNQSLISAQNAAKTAEKNKAKAEETEEIEETELLEQTKEQSDGTELLAEEADSEQTQLLVEEKHSTPVSSAAETTEVLTNYLQYVGKGINEKSDIYSLGATLVFLLAGRTYGMDPKVNQEIDAFGLFREIADSGFMTFRLYENMAILYENMQDFEEAEHVLEKMVSDYPNSYVPYKRLAFLEADIQQNKASKDRDYSKMKEYYELCRKLYDNSEDTEMQVLEKLMDDVINGGW